MRAKPWVPARTSRPLLVATGIFAVGSFQTPAHSDECAPELGPSTCIDADNLWAHPGGGPFFSLGSTVTAPAEKASFGLTMSYLSRPVGFRVASPDPEGTVINALDSMLDATFLWSFGITDRLELAIASPVTVYQNGSGLADVLGNDTELQRSVLRDPRVGVAFAILPPPRTGPADGFSLLSRFDLGLPLGDKETFAGAPTVTGVPTFTGQLRTGKLRFAAEIGARLRGSTVLADTRVGSQLYGALGGAFDVLPNRWLTVAAEAFALYTIADQPKGGAAVVPIEWIASATSAPFFAGDFSLSLGGGSSIPVSTEATLTSPRFRFNLGIRYAPTGRDTDGDGVLDRDDLCPSAPEDHDGFKDGDGCPEPDNDGDGILDSKDRCRDAPETVDGSHDDDGCPDLDDDNDGVPDEDDKCRNEPEDRDGFQDSDGCPEPDNDGDGLEDKRDMCPNGAEDVDGFKDADGCPDPDNDLDQIPDANDRCPDAPEDRDGFQDSDGCPDPDNDEDGVLDAADACPLTAETIDGTGDNDGCPEPGGRSLPRWSGDQVLFDALVRFPAASSKPPPALAAQIRMIAQLLRGRAPLDTVIVEVYPERQGDQSLPALELAGARASALKTMLAAASIPAERITAAAGDPSTKRAPGAPQIEITATRVRSAAAARSAQRAVPSTTGENNPK